MSRILLDSTQGELEFLIFKESIYRLQKEVREVVVELILHIVHLRGSSVLARYFLRLQPEDRVLLIKEAS